MLEPGDVVAVNFPGTRGVKRTIPTRSLRSLRVRLMPGPLGT
jgi:hypothetical protein